MTPTDNPDRNLLLGILAVNLSFITRDELIAAMKAWIGDRSKTLDAILVEQAVLTPERQVLLQALVVEHLKLHENDVQQSLAAVSSVDALKADLADLGDIQVAATLTHVAEMPAKPAPTRAAGAQTSAGGRFRILRPHAKGGLGQVYVAEDQELNRRVALKEIQDRHADNPESRARFMIEAEITGALEHPGIVPVYGLGQYGDGRPFYAMRFIQGDSLKDAIDHFHQADGPTRDPGERTLELRKLLGRFIDVCEAIQYAHDRGVLHRDLKPGNIMLGRYGQTLVVDWGLAKALDQPETPTGEPPVKPASASGTAETLPGSAVGTPQYMSPEQAAGRLGEVGTASDIYSLGATLYALLTGRPSVLDSDANGKPRDLARLLGKVMEGKIDRPRSVNPNIDPALEAICLKAMALKPENRYATVGTLAADIEKWLADEPVSAWEEPWTVKTRRWVGKHRTLVTSTAVFVVVGAISLLVSTVLLANANDIIRDKNQKLSDANDAITKESEEKERQRNLAVAAHQKAEERLDQAVETLKLFAIDARAYCEDAMVPGASKQKLFDVVLRQLEEQAAARADSEFNVDKVRARIFLYETVALIDIELRRPGTALKILEPARKLADEWLAIRPEDPAALARRAAVLHEMGTASRSLRNLKAAQEQFQQAYEIRKKLLGNEQVERFTPAKTIIDLADSLDALERWDEAIAMRQRAYDAVKKRIADTKGKADDIHFALDGMNWTYQKAAEQTKDYAKKKEYLDKANETSKDLAKLRPNGRQALARWAKNVRLYAETERQQADLAEKGKDDNKAQAHRAAAHQQLAKHVQLTLKLATSEDQLRQRRQYADAFVALARHEKDTGDAKQAGEHLKVNLHIREELERDYPLDNDIWTLRLEHYHAQALLGRHVEAADASERFSVKLAHKDHLSWLARIYGRCIIAVEETRKPAKLTADDIAL
ncbi:MAG TPA: serine/threonine-protein kinase, partial [Gemmataceae bacterium]|nr:serine/threonine-protein kinase [Gemmataceae bacterium]